MSAEYPGDMVVRLRVVTISFMPAAAGRTPGVTGPAPPPHAVRPVRTRAG